MFFTILPENIYRRGHLFWLSQLIPFSMYAVDIAIFITCRRQLKDLCPDIHIIFVTSHEKYAIQASALHATGYLMKPGSSRDIRRELTFLYGEAPAQKAVRALGGLIDFLLETGRPYTDFTCVVLLSSL